MQRGLTTVMIPSYNYAQYLAECVESAAAQTHVDVAIVDNGSTDGSPEIAERLAARYENVRLTRYDDNQGIITSFNRCRREVRGEYAVLLCADDCLTPGSLARSAAFMDTHPQVGLVYGPCTYFRRLEEVTAEQLDGEVQTPIVYAGAQWIERLCRTGLNPIRTPEAVARSSVLQQVGGYEPRCPYTSDLNLWLRVASVSDVAYLPGPLQALFRRHETNEGLGFPHSSAAELSQRWSAYAAFFEATDSRRQRSGWDQMARRALGREARYSATRAYVRGEEEEVNLLLSVSDEIDPRDPMGERLGWMLRRKLGPAYTRRFPGFVPRPMLHRLSRVRGERRRERSGVP
jgi:Glycosyl transferase family 2